MDKTIPESVLWDAISALERAEHHVTHKQRSDAAMALRVAIHRSEAAAALQGTVRVPVEPTEGMWGGLARDIIFWHEMRGPNDRPTPRSLFAFLDNLGREIPQWLRDEPEMKNLDHAISKGTRAVIIYRAMLAAAPEEK